MSKGDQISGGTIVRVTELCYIVRWPDGRTSPVPKFWTQ